MVWYISIRDRVKENHTCEFKFRCKTECCSTTPIIASLAKYDFVFKYSISLEIIFIEKILL